MLLINLSIFLLLFIAPSTAYAYLDPGSGSIIFQLLIGGVLGALITLKIYFRRLKNWAAKVFKKKAAPTEEGKSDQNAKE